MSDPTLSQEERRLRDALRAEEESLPVRLVPADLERRSAERRRHRLVRRVELLLAAIVVLVIGVGGIWVLGHRGDAFTASEASIAPSPTIAGPISGPVSVVETFPTGPGLSLGRASLSLSDPKSPTASFAIGCTWSVSGHVMGLSIGKQVIGGEDVFVRWKLALGPQYEIELVEPDQTTFIGLGSNYVSQATPDGHNGAIAFTNLTLNSGDPSTAPRRSGIFTWTCDEPATPASSAPPLPSPIFDGNGVPVLWIIQNGTPVDRAFASCPIELNASSGGFGMSCVTNDWWNSPGPADPVFKVGSGDSLGIALAGWTVTSAQVLALPAAAGGPMGTGPTVDDPLQDLHPVLGNGVVTFSTPELGSWYVHFVVEAAMDDGSTLSAEYTYPITAL
jgi:hypothetical protein